MTTAARADPARLAAEMLLGIDPESMPRGWWCDRPDCDGEPHGGFHWCDHELDSPHHTPWCRHARAEQRPPGGLAWFVWLILAGRGWGKTRTGAEWLAEQVIGSPPGEWAIVARTYADCRDTCVEGSSGFLVALERHGLREGDDFTYNRSLGEVRFATGSVVFMFSDEKPDAIRGKNLRGAWCDEVGTWRNALETWHEALLHALRIGDHPRVVVTTTPKPTGQAFQLLRELSKRADGTVHRTSGSMRSNVRNLSAIAVAELERRYAGTRRGRQELDGELLEEVEGALWERSWFDRDRVAPGVLQVRLGGLDRVVVAVDPQAGTGEESETGIIVAGRGALDGHGYVISDRSLNGSPHEWGSAAVAAFMDLEADVIVAEKNNGGEMVRHVIHTVNPQVPVRLVWASRGKRVRAEPVAAMYEQQRWHHVGAYPLLEDELCTWVPDAGLPSPNRLDALVWAGHELFPLGDADARAIPTRDSRFSGRRAR